MLGSAAALIWLLRLLLARPTALNAVGSAALAAGLLLVSVAVVGINDRGNLARANPAGTIATVARSIETDAANGDVASLL
ncbi:hypothetical protein, partial [Streptomyces sp. CHA16]|uniref:hypothetical protein n=1 Tax=Streptomyces sp. CHA16 TaxID=2841667 RepID=UPI00209443FB